MHTHTKAQDDAWKITPQQYEATRPPIYTIPQPGSRYLTMRDGCRLAVDIYLPGVPDPLAAQDMDCAAHPPRDGANTIIPRRHATLVLFTPYYRRFKMAPEGQGEPAPNIAKLRDYFVPRGYAVVVIDVRGTGASFGTRDSFRSPREREDSREVIDWIVAQPWSNGEVGATGISYLGAASDFLASAGHPAVRAIAPLFSVWDTYTDNYYPGGIQLKALTQSYDDLMVALDHDQRHLLQRFVYYANPDFRGPQPVDEDPDGELLKQAIHQHMSNFRQTEFMPEFRFREDPLPYDASFSSASFSPYSVSKGIPKDVAVLSVSGWMDGAGYMNAAISRFLTLSDNPRHLLLGPWDHGARIDISPWRKEEMAEALWLPEVLRFFDYYLLGMDNGLDDEEPIHYYALHAEQWRAASQWPPLPASSTCILSLDGQSNLRPNLLEQKLFHPHIDAGQKAEASPQTLSYQVDFNIGTGKGTRYERIAAINSTEYYADWQGRGDAMLNFTSPPLLVDAELTGHAVVELWLSSSEPDAALFVYLTEVEADGKERYVSEGLLRLLHRKESPCPDTYRSTWPFRSFKREDAAPMVPGVMERIRLAMLATCWRFSRGSRIRLSIAGSDKDHCGQVPHGRPPLLKVGVKGELTSHIHLPLRYEAASPARSS